MGKDRWLWGFRNIGFCVGSSLSLGFNPPHSNNSVMEGGRRIWGDLLAISAIQNFKLPTLDVLTLCFQTHLN